MRRVAASYAVITAALVVVYFAVPASRTMALVALAVASAAAVGIGVGRYRPRTALWWWMLAVAVLLCPTGSIIYDALPGRAGELKPWNWVVWVDQGLMLALIVVAVLGLTRSALRGISALIDGAIIILGAGLIGGLVVAIPYAQAASGVIAGARVAFVLRDVIIFALVVHGATAVRLSMSVVTLLTGMSGFVIYDVLYRISRSRGEREAGDVIDLGLLAFIALTGAAALWPSMARFDTPAAGSERRAAPVRLGLVVLLALAPSAVLLRSLLRGPPPYEALILVISSLILVLALARMIDVTWQLSRQVRGERVVRDTVIELAAVRDVDAVAPALEAAVRRLFGRPRPAVVVLPDAVWLPDEPPSAAAAGQMLPVAQMGRSAAEALPGRGEVLAIGLRSASGPEAGRGPILLVRGSRTALSGARARLQLLATQASMAVDRIELGEENLRHRSEAYFRTLVRNSTEVILILDDDDRVRYASPAADQLFGSAGSAGVVGESLSDLVDADDRTQATDLLRRTRAGVVSTSDMATRHGEWSIPGARGQPARVEVYCRDLRDDPTIAGLVITVRNVTRQRALEQELTYQAQHDPLTGLANRLPFTRRIDIAVENRDRALSAVVYLDLDDLKAINDIYGHEAGDAVLVAVGERMNRFADRYGGADLATAARLGGDEFAILLTELQDAESVARHLLDDVAQPVTVYGVTIGCTVSVGFATTNDDVTTGSDLLGNADLALYAAKAAGKAQVRRYEPPMRHTLAARLQVRTLLKDAVVRDQLTLEYQPIVSLATGATVGFEALLRWNHPTRGRLTPDSFIDIAEESGLIGPIGEWVLITATHAAREWSSAANVASPYVSVNVSAKQFRSSTFLSTVDRALEASGLKPDRLMLEITESLLLRDDDNVWQDLNQLHRRGTHIAIDDFGTGYSALSYLRHVPLDVIKLDRTFTQTMATSAQQRGLVRGIVGLAHTLGLEVIAEGIQTAGERDTARLAGCAYGQGFLYSRPIPVSRIPAWLQAPEHCG